MPNPVKSLEYMQSHSSDSPRPVKSPSNSVDTTVRRYAVDREDLKPHNWKSEKRPHFSRWSTILLFTSHRKKTNRAVVFSFRPFPNILKYRDH